MRLVLRKLSKAFGAQLAVDNVELSLAEGKLICLLGPSGCGKTTLLRLIAGLETPTRGSVSFDGVDITELPAHRRGFGMVFQSLALFPHLNVGDNIAYGLAIAGVAKATRQQRVAELLDMVQLPGIGDRPVGQLSGGQKQRVAIARALALQPKLFLLDEPLSALDAKLRESMQVELRLLQQRLRITTIVVTHDQREALTLADQVVVMSHGTIQQVGAPLEIYRRPRNAFVAGFIGSSNLLPGEVLESRQVLVAGRPIAVASDLSGYAAGDRVTLSIRPEDVRLHHDGEPSENCLHGKVRFVRDFGASVETYVDCGDVTLISSATAQQSLRPGLGVSVAAELPADVCIVLNS